MKFFYDTANIFPYVCLSDFSDLELREFIEFMKDRGLVVTRIYEKDEIKRPASNKVWYTNLLRISFEPDSKIRQADAGGMYKMFEEFKGKSSSKSKNESAPQEREQIYINQMKTLLESQKKAFDINWSYFGEQLKSITDSIKQLNADKNETKIALEQIRRKLENESSETAYATSNEDIHTMRDRIAQYETTLSKLKKTLEERDQEINQSKQDLDDYREELQEEYKSLVRKIREISLGVNVDEGQSHQNFKILIFGETKMKMPDIYDIFNSKFIRAFEDELSKKCIDARLLSYDKIKNSNLVNKIKRDKYDYIIVGPHPHSIRGKDINQTFTSFVSESRLKAKVYENKDAPLSREQMIELAEIIIDNWKSQF